MIEHLVLFKFKAGTADGAMKAVEDGLRALKGKVPSIVDLSVGRNFSERAAGYQSGLVVRFKDKAGLEAYAVHPEHVKVVNELVKPVVEHVLALDYEF